jgi:hypothetical protein
MDRRVSWPQLWEAVNSRFLLLGAKTTKLFCCWFAVRVFRSSCLRSLLLICVGGAKVFFFHHGAETHVPQAPLLCHQVEPDASRQNSWWEMASSFPFLFPLLRNGLQREEAGKRELEGNRNKGIERLSFSKYRSTRMERVNNDLNLWTEATRDRKASLPSLQTSVYFRAEHGR